MVIKSLILFNLLLIIGLLIVIKTSPWGDEIYTIHNLQTYSYTQIIQGKLPEGCNEPLFYVLQKLFGAVKYLPILFSALTITIAFMYYPSWITIALFLSLKIVWQHFAEIRPYSLILLLSTIQCLILNKKINIKWLWLINILMAFTDSICVVPILFSGIMAIKNNMIKSVWILIIPTMIIIYYFYASVYSGDVHKLPGFSNRYFIYFLPYAIIGLVRLFI